MIPMIRGWQVVQDGERWLQVPQHGDDHEGVVYWERRRPVRSALHWAQDLPLPVDAEITALSPVRRIVTQEGEYASLIITQVRYQGTFVHRSIAVIDVDDFNSIIIGHVRRPDKAEWYTSLIEELARNDRHYLSTRRRPYIYQAPPDWHAVSLDSYTTQWIAPNNAHNMIVLPALPLSAEEPRQVLSEMMSMTGQASLSVPIWARGGLQGECYSVHAADRVCDVALLVDDRFFYGVCGFRPAHGVADGAQSLLKLAQTIEPIPRNRWQNRSSAMFLNWGE